VKRKSGLIRREQVIMSLNYLPLPVYVSFCLFLSIVLISFFIYFVPELEYLQQE